ncbi:MAG: LapA family protein [Mariprofundaceae bacterium]|nr:LapA family protein [Mariprofundaceae bacterium]
MPKIKRMTTMSVFSSGRKHWLNIAVMALLTAFFITFALSNLALVNVALLGLKSQEIPFYMPVFIAFILGFSGGMLSLSFSRRKHKQEISQLRKENNVLHQEVENLRNIPLQDDV